MPETLSVLLTTGPTTGSECWLRHQGIVAARSEETRGQIRTISWLPGALRRGRLT